MQPFLHRRRDFWIFALALLLPSELRAEGGILVVHVEDTKCTVSGVELAPKGDDASGALTDRLGKTRLRLAPATRSGQWMMLQILPRKSGPDWVFVGQLEEKVLGANHPDVVTSLNNLAMLYHKQDKLKSAESFAKRPKGDGAAGPPTDKLGKTRLRLAPSIKPGHWVTLQILPRKGGPDWVFISPWDQRILVPSFANEPGNFVHIILGKRGSRDLLASDQSIQAMTALILEQLGPKLDKSGVTEEERKRALEEQAAAFGLKPEEVDKAVRTWGATAQDPYIAGLAALYENNYPEAEERLEKSLEVRRQEQNEILEKVANTAFFLGNALFEQSKYREAAAAYQESLDAGGKEDVGLNAVGVALQKVGDLKGAASRLERVLELREKNKEVEPLDMALSLHNLAVVYRKLGRYGEAESLSKRSLTTWEKVLGTEHPALAPSLNNLAVVYENQSRYAQAESLHKRSLEVREKALGAEHPDVAASLNNLAAFYCNRGRYLEAEPLYQRSLKIWEKALGAEHPDVALSLNNLAFLYQNQGRYAEAEFLYQRSLRIRENILGAEHLDVALSLNNLAFLYENQGRYAETEPLYQCSLKIREKILGAEHPDVAASLNDLAVLYFRQEKFAIAEDFSKRASTIAEKSLGPCYLDTVTFLENRAGILKALGRADEAQILSERVKKSKSGECTSQKRPSVRLQGDAMTDPTPQPENPTPPRQPRRRSSPGRKPITQAQSRAAPAA